jgi:hypothetical protein
MIPLHHLTDDLTGRVRHFPSPESIRNIPRNPAALVTGTGAIWTLNDPLAIYGSYNSGLTAESPSTIALLGFAVAC